MNIRGIWSERFDWLYLAQRWRSVADPSEHSNGSLDSVKCKKFLNTLPIVNSQRTTLPCVVSRLDTNKFCYPLYTEL
jgi:hypothetical protein